MSYPTVKALQQQWNLFESAVMKLGFSAINYLPEIKKLMTAVSVVDLSLHEIYAHARYVHELTANLIQVRNNSTEGDAIQQTSQLWLNLLRTRHQTPLKIKHHQRLDGECDFKFTLQLMEGKPCGFKDVQVLDHKDNITINSTISAMHRLDCIVFGTSFAELPLMNNAVITSLMDSEDVICVIARDQSDQIVGHSWGIYLKDVKVRHNQTANIFWWMEVARDPDFYDAHNKVGELLRAKTFSVMKEKGGCDFFGYQHKLNHQFHMNIISVGDGEDERLHLNQESYPAKTTIRFDEDLCQFMRTHLVKLNDKHIEFPDIKNIKSDILNAFWKAAHTAKDFILGGIMFFKRQKNQQSKNLISDSIIDERITADITIEKQDCDSNILKNLILSHHWMQQGSGFLGAKKTPATINKMQNSARSDFYFPLIKYYAENCNRCLTRNRLVSSFYTALATADSPTQALDNLIRCKEMPTAWIQFIDQSRNVSNTLSHFKLA
jgi:hypothetical protein